jgi:hypothetical protein
MSVGRSYVERIIELDWDGLRQLWAAIEDRQTPGWPPGKAFEHLVLRAFQLDGAEVRWPYAVRGVGPVESREEIEQIDGAVYAKGLWCLVQSKDTEDRVNVQPIAILRNQLLRRPSPAIGLLFSVGGFTSPAQVLAGFLAPQTILLWNRDDIGYCVERQQVRSPLLRKYRACVEEGRADHSLLAEEEKP